MKKILPLLLFIITGFCYQASAQTAAATPTQKILTDSLCNCVSRLDQTKITTKQQAINEYTACVGNYLPLLQKLATEKGLDFSNTEDMKSLGVEIAQNLMKQKCEGFTKLALLLAEKRDVTGGSTVGVFKRIDNKGFNYIVLNYNGNESSFIWYKQFPGSEKFMQNTAALIGKKLKIGWVDVEVYLPAAKGYYRLKEITSIEVL